MFIQGSKEDMGPLAALVASRGIAAAAPSYALADPQDDRPGWPRNLHDAKCAVRFLRANSGALGIDKRRIAVLGHSSGAYLALMVGFTSHLKELEGDGPWQDQSSRVTAVVNIAGVCDRRAGLGTGTRYLLGAGYESQPV